MRPGSPRNSRKRSWFCLAYSHEADKKLDEVWTLLTEGRREAGEGHARKGLDPQQLPIHAKGAVFRGRVFFF